MKRKEQIYTESYSSNQDYGQTADDSFEKANFSKRTYERIKRARRKGKLHGVKLPYLQYNLTKSKPRPKLIVIAIFTTIVMLLGFAGGVYSFIAGVLPLIQFSFGATESAENILKIPIADLFVGVGIGILWVIVLCLMAAIITVVALLVSNTLKLFNLSRVSVEEFSYSHEVSDLFSNFATTSFLSLVIGFFTAFSTSELGLPIGLLIIVIGILFIVSTILLIIERSKARKELVNTDPARLDFIKNYFAGIRRICKHKTLTQTFFEFSRW